MKATINFMTLAETPGDIAISHDEGSGRRGKAERLGQVIR
jgi:hypothetical protein